MTPDRCLDSYSASKEICMEKQVSHLHSVLFHDVQDCLGLVHMDQPRGVRMDMQVQLARLIVLGAYIIDACASPNRLHQASDAPLAFRSQDMHKSPLA